MQHVLEIAAFTLDGALRAQAAGADRIELCENASDGGTTPSYGFLKKAIELLTIPVFPIIRPRGGHFYYSQHEFEILKADIQLCRELGYTGIVVGMLDQNGHLPISHLREIMAIKGNMQVTFHRAFDRCANPQVSMEQLIDLGVTRILTSGQYPTVSSGLSQLMQLVEQAQDRIIIMPGSGLNSKNVKEIALQTKAKEFHTAARMQYVDSAVKSPASMNENMAWVSVDEEEVSAIKRILNAL
jgi:copper homeostasis protein